MVMEARSMQKRRYIFAALLTALVFTLGLMLGIVIEGKRADIIQERVEEQSVDINSLRLQHAFIDQLHSQKNCAALDSAFERSLTELENTRVRVENYRNSANFNAREFDLLRRSYVLSQLDYMLLSEKTNRLCSSDVANVLYFFSKECSTCDDQSFILTFLRQKLKERMFVFAFDASFTDEPVLQMLLNSYNVTEFPTIIIRNNTYVGFMPKDNLSKAVCESYETPFEACLQ